MTSSNLYTIKFILILIWIYVAVCVSVCDIFEIVYIGKDIWIIGKDKSWHFFYLFMLFTLYNLYYLLLLYYVTYICYVIQ